MHHTRIARRLACALTGVAATALAVAPAAAVPGTFTTIDVPGAADSIAGAVNDSGVVAGFYIDSRGTRHGFIDRHGRFTKSNDPHAGRARVAGSSTTTA